MDTSTGWWAAVYGVAQSRTRLKRLSMQAYIGEGNGNPLQYSCLGNPRDRGAWWSAVYEVAQSPTRLKRLSSSSSRESGEEAAERAAGARGQHGAGAAAAPAGRPGSRGGSRSRPRRAAWWRPPSRRRAAAAPRWGGVILQGPETPRGPERGLGSRSPVTAAPHLTVPPPGVALAALRWVPAASLLRSAAGTRAVGPQTKARALSIPIKPPASPPSLFPGRQLAQAPRVPPLRCPQGLFNPSGPGTGAGGALDGRIPSGPANLGVMGAADLMRRHGALSAGTEGVWEGVVRVGVGVRSVSHRGAWRLGEEGALHETPSG
ncbi:collagen alpha-1(I) chain-like isoform X1 [Ovis aries]|uniref:collagen alpha-1(I) chain-like isoform X1 n=1 Tax=Ovis aries TaxID=9940 RepID=UPI0029526B66|nr:collagen alpha-1(I) chain-like isoform X1 [Ovis aries]